LISPLAAWARHRLVGATSVSLKLQAATRRSLGWLPADREACSVASAGTRTVQFEAVTASRPTDATCPLPGRRSDGFSPLTILCKLTRSCLATRLLLRPQQLEQQQQPQSLATATSVSELQATRGAAMRSWHPARRSGVSGARNRRSATAIVLRRTSTEPDSPRRGGDRLAGGMELLAPRQPPVLAVRLLYAGGGKWCGDDQRHGLNSSGTLSAVDSHEPQTAARRKQLPAASRGALLPAAKSSSGTCVT
jgi:hypothetical protein